MAVICFATVRVLMHSFWADNLLHHPPCGSRVFQCPVISNASVRALNFAVVVIPVAEFVIVPTFAIHLMYESWTSA